jgi:hypothetical protein
MPVIRDFLMQRIEEKAPLEETKRRLLEIAASVEGTTERTEAENEEV